MDVVEPRDTVVFIIICFKATTYIEEKLGWLAALLFVVDLLSFLNINKSVSGNVELPKHAAQQPHFTFDASHEMKYQPTLYAYQEFEAYVAPAINMVVIFGKRHATGQTVPVKAYFDLSGLLGGHLWHFVALQS